MSASQVRDAVESAFRDYETAGVPASGDHEPVKSEIRYALGQLLATTLSSIGAGISRYATKAAMDAVTTVDDGQLAYVYADPTPANNTVYQWNDAGGTWDVATWYFDAVAAVVQPLLDDTEAARDAALAAQVAAEAAALILENAADNLAFFSAADLELWPAGRQIRTDESGGIVEDFTYYTPADLELWADGELTVDAGGYVAFRSGPEPVLAEPAVVDPSRVERATVVFPEPVVAGVGHSMIAQGQAAAVAISLSGKLGAAISSLNFGRSSNTARGIAARMNAYYPSLFPRFPTYLPAGGSIPATTDPVDLVPTFGAIDSGPWESYAGVVPTVSATGSYSGIAGTFDLDAVNGLTFTRAVAGSAKPIAAAEPIFVDPKDGGDAPAGATVADYREKLWLLWVGRNSIAATTTGLRAVRALVAHIQSVNAQFILLPDFPQTGEEYGTAGRALLDYWNNLLRDEWPENYCQDEYGVDFLDWAIAAGPNATDKANGLIATEWRSDGLHLNNTGRANTAPFIADFAIRKGMVRGY